MIKIILVLFMLEGFIYADDIDVNLIAQKIDKILKSDKISSKLSYDVYDPFSNAKPIMMQEEITNTKTIQPMKLQTVLNSRAFIDGNWYDAKDKIKGYVIKSIDLNSVTLVKNGKNLVLKLEETEDIVTMKGME